MIGNLIKDLKVFNNFKEKKEIEEAVKAYTGALKNWRDYREAVEDGKIQYDKNIDKELENEFIRLKTIRGAMLKPHELI